MYGIDMRGKHALIMGVANHRSLAWAITECLAKAGARICLTYAGPRLKKDVEELAATLPDAFTIECDVTIDFIAVSSYGSSTKSSGQVRLLRDLDTALEGRQVVIVEDIVDTGRTLTYLQDILRARAPRSLRTACLLSKPSRREVEVTVEYVGFTIEDQFVVGYGLDHHDRYRNLPYIAVI